LIFSGLRSCIVADMIKPLVVSTLPRAVRGSMLTLWGHSVSFGRRMQVLEMQNGEWQSSVTFPNVVANVSADRELALAGT
jgi:hypothetical protein